MRSIPVIVALSLAVGLTARLLPGKTPPRPSPAEPPATAPAAGTIPPREQWETVRLDDLTSEVPAVARRLRAMDEAAGALAGPGWEHQPYHVKQPDFILWTAWWGTPAGTIGPWGTFEPPAGRGAGRGAVGERHLVVIEAYRRRTAPRTIDEVVLMATWAPPGPGWGASVEYAFPAARRSLHGTAFDLAFAYRQDPAPPGQPPARPADSRTPHPDADVDAARQDHRGPVRLSEHLTRFRRDKDYGDTRYGIDVTIGGPGNDDEDVRRWYASPESLRDAALARLDRLSAKVETDVPSGAAVGHASRREARLTPAGGATVVPAALRPPPPPSSRKLTGEEKREILNEARAEIGRTRGLVLDHHAAMHAALLKAFPLADCLK